ncbi:MAG: hypothetical protein IJL14_00975 [Selenomonadaceae bacterium]|nr:hypothetical protein [Selenomonadaceae bacterium]
MEAEEKLQVEMPEPTDSLARCRQWFQEAVDGGQDWRRAAKEDYEFTAGKQWTDEEIQAFAEDGRPAITINRIKPLLNILSGYQRLNRYDVEFAARSSDDVDLCQVRRGITKYVMDRCDYDAVESQVFMDCSIGGLGWFGVRYKMDYEVQDGEAVIERIDPFSIYIDPEAHELDYSDARFLIRAKWVAKDELKQIYPEQADAIENNFAVYDSTEEESEGRPKIDRLYYSGELKKVRVVECWYKERTQQTIFFTADGQQLPQEQVTPDMIQMGMIAGSQDFPRDEVKLCVFFDKTLLEEIPSPYQHGEFPYVPMIYHYYGVGDVPAGFVRDLKDPQREVNKRRIQELHLLNTTANGGGWIEEGAMTPDQESEFKRKNAIPGHYQKVTPGGLDRIREREPKQPPMAVIQAEQQAVEDLKTISGINESMLGVEVPSQASGRAIELRQKQSITHLAVIFDALRRAKKKIAYLLWGRRGHAGVIPQFYTAEKTYRIEGENGQEFIPVNQQVIQQDPLAGVIVKTLNDLSQGEFDIIIADVESNTTQRQAQLWSLIDAVSKLGIPHDLIFDTLIDLSDLPKKNDIKLRFQQQQAQQAQQAQQQWQSQLELERVKNADFRMQIAFKDAPLPIQFAMAAKAELIPWEVANHFLQVMVQQMAPQLATQMNPQMPPPNQMPQAPPPPVNQPQPQPQTMTQAAAQSVINGIAPAVV